MKKNKFLFCIGLLLTVATIVNAQSVTWISSTEGNVWQKSKVKLQSKSEQNPVLQVDGTENGVAFKNWGTTFNELCWDALGLLTRTEQDEILYNIFSISYYTSYNIVLSTAYTNYIKKNPACRILRLRRVAPCDIYPSAAVRSCPEGFLCHWNITE